MYRAHLQVIKMKCTKWALARGCAAEGILTTILIRDSYADSWGPRDFSVALEGFRLLLNTV